MLFVVFDVVCIVRNGEAFQAIGKDALYLTLAFPVCRYLVVLSAPRAEARQHSLVAKSQCDY